MAKTPISLSAGRMRLELAMTDHGFAAHQRNMHRAVAANQVENAFDQRIPAKIAKFTQRGSIAEMIVAIGVASRTAQRTFAGDLNRKKRNPATQEPATRHVQRRGE